MSQQNKFLAVDCNSIPWIQGQLPNGQSKGVEYRPLLHGGNGLPQVHMARYEPGWVEARHRHPEDEVLTIMEGELTVEGQAYKAPSVIFVSRGTLYGPLTAGAEGVVLMRVAYTEKMIGQAETRVTA